ncbi:MAG: S49 family peptidase [Gemmataceae bacterium]
MQPDLLLPAFPRITDYLGAWCFEPTRFETLLRGVRVADFTAHVAAIRQAGPVASRGAMRYTEMIAAAGGQQVAVIKMAGTLMKGESSFGGTSTVQLRREIRAVAADESVSGILLAIDSPGGTSAGTADLAAEVKMASRKKPVWAHIDDLGASAAYYVASQANLIYANTADALVGSIGTMMMIYDASGAFEKEGIKPMLFKTGPLKGAGSMGSAVSEEQAAYFQKIIDGLQEGFDAAVKSGRGLSAKELDAVRTGGVFLASEAKQLRLIDGIRPLAKTLAELSAAK